MYILLLFTDMSTLDKLINYYVDVNRIFVFHLRVCSHSIIL